MKRSLLILALVALVGCSSVQHTRRSAEGRRINIGYQTVSPEQNTGPVGHISPDDKEFSGYTDLAAYLQGKIAGVQVGIDPTTRQRAILIRGGSNSILGSNAALILVDGVEMPDFDTANAAVSLYSIKSIDVLKDGSIYGARGANGVVLITTK